MQSIIRNINCNINKDYNSNRHWQITILSITTVIILMLINCHNSYANTKHCNIKLTSINQQNNQQNSDVVQNNNATTALEKDKPIERELKGGEAHSYTITMEANQYLNAVVEQKGIDVVVAVFGPDSKKVYEIDSPNGIDGPESIYFITESKGQYKIEVRSLEKEAKLGKYQASISELRVAIEQDKFRVDGYKAYGEAELIQDASTLELTNQKIAKYEEAITAFAKADELLAQAHALNSLGLIYLTNIRDYDKAEKLHQQSLTIKEKMFPPDHYEIGVCLSYLATVRFYRNDYKNAEILYQRSLGIFEKTLGENSVDVASTAGNLAEVYKATGDYAKAETLYQRALTIKEKLLGPDHIDVAIVLETFAELYKNTGDYVKAEALYQRALTIKQKGVIDAGIARTLTSMAALYQTTGDYVKAEALYQGALPIFEKTLGLEHSDVGTLFNNLAILYNDTGDYVKAEPLFQKALAIREKISGPQSEDVASTLNNFASMYQLKGDYIKAESLYQRSMAILENVVGSEHPNIISLINNLALLYQRKGDYTKAKELFQKSLTLRKKVLGPVHSDVAVSLSNLAGLYVTTGGYREAEDLLQQALVVAEQAVGPESFRVAESLHNLASLYKEKGEYVKAEPLYQHALTIFERIFGREHPTVARMFNSIALLYRAKGDIEQTIKYQDYTNETREQELIKNLISGSEKEKLIYLNLTAFELDQTLSLHLLSAINNQQASRLALTEILRRKGRALDAMTDNIANLRRRANKEDQALLDQLANARAQYATLSLKGTGKAGVEQHQIKLKTLVEQIESLEKEVSNRSAEFKIQSQPITLATVQQAIPNNAVLIEFAAYTQYDNNDKPRTRHYAAYILTNIGEPLFADLGDADAIDQAITKLRDILPNRKSSITKDVKPAARALDQLIMQPVRKLLGDKKRLLIAPDGALNLVPFDALVDEHNKYLVENYEISYLTSGRDLLRLQNGIKSDNAPLVMADPDFAQGPGPKFGEESFEPLKRLESTADEANQIKSELASEKPTVLLQTQATKSALIAVHRPAILHIATHGFFLGNESANLTETQRIAIRHKIEEGNSAGISLQNPLLRSGLFFANANAQGEDATLTALEATGLDLWGTKLVVLSACNTGVGEVKSGDGVYGLRRALVLAGSESQMMSLWPVSDKGTKDLMVAYYEALKHDEGRSAGLRKVRLSFLKKPDRAHPYYWASFIQSGEWANLKGQR